MGNFNGSDVRWFDKTAAPISKKLKYKYLSNFLDYPKRKAVGELKVFSLAHPCFLNRQKIDCKLLIMMR